MIRLRDLIYAVGALVTAPVWVVGMWRAGKLRTDWRGRLGFGEALPNVERRRVLIYGVSVGEVAAARTLLAELQRRGWEVVVAAMTDTGVTRARQIYAEGGGDVAVVRWPYDFSGAVRRLLRRVRPDVVVLMELEVWPNALAVCAREGVPVVVANGRLSARSFRGYRRARPLLRGSFALLARVAAQTPAYAERFVAMGVPAERVSVLGSMKWDSAAVAEVEALRPRAAALAARLGLRSDRPVVVAGSTAPGEDAMLLDGWLGDAVHGRAAGVQLVLVPRKPEWFEAVVVEAGRRGVPVVRWSGVGEEDRTAEAVAPMSVEAPVVLVDTVGVLGDAYAVAAVAHADGVGGVAVVGRSFTGELYGSDMVEPIGVGVPTVVGPHTRDFEAMVQALAAGDALRVAEDPWAGAAALLADRAEAARLLAAGRAVIRAQQGAAVRHADLVEGLVGSGGPRLGLNHGP